MKPIAIFIPLALAACTTAPAPPETVRTVEVKVPVRQACVPTTLGGAPDYPDDDAALRKAPDAAARYKLLYAGRKLRIPREQELETVVAGCK
ncbi:hypothetical protein [Novosphingobium resinovorum]|uniref:Lipoprotein n=1 Tax=Novosphingobium resinovorum TaxID=158500 RepID=A0A1D8A3B1_9SPHN|nr:hypothetical protein [Novosphingobium resinovorum]AOR76550.1 hypothetical protein BES08_07170 [Novosphingobium resinovorum]